jgi:hypothetical protein
MDIASSLTTLSRDELSGADYSGYRKHLDVGERGPLTVDVHVGDSNGKAWLRRELSRSGQGRARA